MMTLTGICTSMISVGNDIEEVTRFKKMLESKPQLLLKMFTNYEWEYAAFKNQAQTLAGIWCAKEAVVKSLSNFMALDIRDVEINHYQNGAPYLYNIKNFAINKMFEVSISISHTKNYATAVCITKKSG